MATLKLHYDGWLVLPAGLRRALELESGDRLEAELVDGAIVLRPAKGKRPATRPEKVAELPVAVSVPTSLPEAPAVAKRPRGRPRKVPVAPAQAELLLGPAEAPLPSPKRKPGRPRKVVTAELAAVVEPEPGSALRKAVCGSCGRRQSCRSPLPSLFPCHPAELSPPERVAAMSARSGGHFGMSRCASWGRDAGTIDRSGARAHRDRPAAWSPGFAHSPKPAQSGPICWPISLISNGGFPQHATPATG